MIKKLKNSNISSQSKKKENTEVLKNQAYCFAIGVKLYETGRKEYFLKTIDLPAGYEPDLLDLEKARQILSELIVKKHELRLAEFIQKRDIKPLNKLT